MKNTSREFDAYIEKAAPFARPILTRVRKLFHEACPEVREVMKWSSPHFEHKGLLGGMAAFKEHAVFGFWKASLLDDKAGILKGVGDTAMGRAKLTSVDDLPPDKVLLAYIQQAVRLNEEGVKVERPKRPASRKPIAVPKDLLSALKKNKAAAATFEGFSPSHRKEYIEWLTEARQEATRARRLEQAIAWMAQGKPRNWKYAR